LELLGINRCVPFYPLDMVGDAIKGHLEVEEELEREAHRKKRVA
jgi:hypothetical protein